MSGRMRYRQYGLGPVSQVEVFQTARLLLQSQDCNESPAVFLFLYAGGSRHTGAGLRGKENNNGTTCRFVWECTESDRPDGPDVDHRSGSDLARDSKEDGTGASGPDGLWRDLRESAAVRSRDADAGRGTDGGAAGYSVSVWNFQRAFSASFVYRNRGND